MKYNNVTKPKHYNQYKIEPLDVIEDWDLPYMLATVIKYIARYRFKGKPLEDLKKGQYYLTRFIDNYENNSIEQDLHTESRSYPISCDKESSNDTESGISSDVEEVREEGLSHESYESELQVLFDEWQDSGDRERLSRSIKELLGKEWAGSCRGGRFDRPKSRDIYQEAIDFLRETEKLSSRGSRRDT